MAKFIYEKVESERIPTFREVALEQFFVNHGGCWCQKTSGTVYHTIASEDGVPLADTRSADPGTEIRRIDPIVMKIEF